MPVDRDNDNRIRSFQASMHAWAASLCSLCVSPFGCHAKEACRLAAYYGLEAAAGCTWGRMNRCFAATTNPHCTNPRCPLQELATRSRTGVQLSTISGALGPVPVVPATCLTGRCRLLCLLPAGPVAAACWCLLCTSSSVVPQHLEARFDALARHAVPLYCSAGLHLCLRPAVPRRP